MKRLFDVVVSTLALLVACPVMLLVAAAVRLQDGSPVLFRQVRTGLQGRPFTMFKFRSMAIAPPGDWKPERDSARLTGLGRVLRSASLDELPQLWNVLRGDMSIVGPRPLPTEYLPLYDSQQSRRHEVRPGITGWAQVNSRNAVSWEQRFALDIWYVDNRSMYLDLRILWLTLRTVLSREGISRSGEATMTKFGGSGK